MKDLMSSLNRIATSTVSDAMGRTGTMVAAMKPVETGMFLAGPAFTVRCYPGDNLTIHHALSLAAPGDVLVVQGGNAPDRALIGEIMALAAKLRGLGGFVIDGAVRDAAGIRALGFPVFCTAVNPSGPVKETYGAVRGPIQCGGVVVNPGDLVVGDDDGVVVLPRTGADAIVSAALGIVDKEERVKAALKEGKTTFELLGLAAKVR